MLHEKSQGHRASTGFPRAHVLIISVLSARAPSSSFSIYSPKAFLTPCKYMIQLDRRKKSIYAKK